MSDRLEEIEERYSSNGKIDDDEINESVMNFGPIPLTEDMRWLISEVERLRAENDILDDQNAQLKDEIDGWELENGQFKESIERLKSANKFLRNDQRKHWQESIDINNLLVETFGKEWTDKFIEKLEKQMDKEAKQ